MGFMIADMYRLRVQLYAPVDGLSTSCTNWIQAAFPKQRERVTLRAMLFLVWTLGFQPGSPAPLSPLNLEKGYQLLHIVA